MIQVVTVLRRGVCPRRSTVRNGPGATSAEMPVSGSGCADVSSLSSRRCSLTSMSAGKADCRRIASRFSRCSVLTEDLPLVGWFGSAPGSLAHVSPLLEFPAGRRAAASVAARQVRRYHRITVIRATGAPQNRSSTDRRECAGSGQPLRRTVRRCLRLDEYLTASPHSSD